MTIDELLALARRNINQADRQHDATSAAIAQAAALTAQAMIAQEQRLEWLAEQAEHDETDRRDYDRSQ